MITFRGRKNSEQFDAMFYVHTTNSKAIYAHADLSRYLVGDKVSVCFGDMALLIKDLQIPCVVVERSWAVQWKQVGALSELSSCSLVLEAESGAWEDVLLWAVCGKVPEQQPHNLEWSNQMPFRVVVRSFN